MRDAIWKEYRRGQERDKKPSLRYLCVQQYAVAELAFKPFDDDAAAVAAGYLDKAIRYQIQAVAKGLGDPLERIAPLEKKLRPEPEVVLGGRKMVMGCDALPKDVVAMRGADGSVSFLINVGEGDGAP